jgi:hypothetical protein
LSGVTTTQISQAGTNEFVVVGVTNWLPRCFHSHHLPFMFMPGIAQVQAGMKEG